MTRVLRIDERAGVRVAERQIATGVAHDHAAKEDVLDWQGFLSRYFPERRRHDLEAITAYAAYRSSGDLDERSSDAVPTAEPEPVDVQLNAADAWEDEGGASV